MSLERLRLTDSPCKGRQRPGKYRVELLRVLEHREMTDVGEHDRLDTVLAQRVDVSGRNAGVDRRGAVMSASAARIGG